MSFSASFEELNLNPDLLSTLVALGYETPTTIQEKSIPLFLQGKDLLAQAQTGTGKTAAFALPILSKIKVKSKQPQALIIVPTRELAIQVADAFSRYAKGLKGFLATPIYGGQDYKVQLNAIKRGPQVVIGTPGRLTDHLRRGKLDISQLKTVVLDEADEMLKMGFADDIENILEHIQVPHQTALFSATIPQRIAQISKKYLTNPERIKVESTNKTVTTIEQYCTQVSRKQKLDTLVSFLEVEDVQAAIIFSGTKSFSAELAERLQSRGFSAAALNGDMNQAFREKVINRLKSGSLDIIVATDVAARGIDVERISHVINYDMPQNAEIYIHRIGRTGRAGRTGKTILFVAPNERHQMREIEQAVGVTMQPLAPPTPEEIHATRNKEISEKIQKMLLKKKKLSNEREVIEEFVATHEIEPTDVAAALLRLLNQSKIHQPKVIQLDEEREVVARKKPKRFSDRKSGDSFGKRHRKKGKANSASDKHKKRSKLSLKKRVKS